MTDSQLLAITALAIRQPRRWSSIVGDNRASIEIEVLEPTYRPLRMETVIQEVTEIRSVRISSSPDKAVTLLLETRDEVSSPADHAA